MFHEKLMEFEESLSLVAPSNDLMLSNMDLKVDLNRFADGKVEILGENDLLQKLKDYNYETDTTNVCSTCLRQFSNSKAECCSKYVRCQKTGFSSDLEKLYWVSFFENPYKTILALPNYTSMLFLQSGIPFQLRGDVWQKLILVNQANHGGIPAVTSQIFKNFQHSYNRDISAQINKDLSRTFPDIEFFQKEETVQALLTVLNVYANYDLELGYCQGILFLVGTLYYQFQHQELTFHALCKIMECEPELRAIFVPSLMSATLLKWYLEFSHLLHQIDPELAHHLESFCDCKVFLLQWWLSILLIHAPGLNVNNRIVDFCLVQGWKVGVFKISIGLLIKNRPILMTFSDGDEEVVYQHLLNESKWGNVVNNLTSFFGDLLLLWDDQLFQNMNCALPPVQKLKTHKRSGSSVLGMLKNLTIPTTAIANTLTPFASNTTHTNLATTHLQVTLEPTLASSMSSSESLGVRGNRSTSSVFSKDRESIYSDVASSYSLETNLKVPKSDLRSLASRTSEDELLLENQMLKFYLKKAYEQLQDETLKQEIREAIDLEA